jgi:Flp pilus assembly protein TadG
MPSTTVRFNSRFENYRSGVAAVEFAVVSPLLLIFMFSIIEITGAIYLQQSLTVAAYEGARVALLPNTDSGNVAAAINRILESRKISGASVSVVPEKFNSADFGDPIQVEVTAPLGQHGFIGRLFSAHQKFSASVTMMKER